VGARGDTSVLDDYAITVTNDKNICVLSNVMFDVAVRVQCSDN